MAATTSKNAAIVAAIAVIIPCLIGVWFVLPFFLPMYLWTKIDLVRISATSNIPKDKLETRFTMKVRYHPRGEGDPIPWQIIEMNPRWQDIYPEAESEDQLLVRCVYISANDGESPSTAFINATFKDRYFTVKALRLPPGSLGHNPKRPVVVYDRMSMDKMDISTADGTQRTIQAWENDDEWEARDDGWSPPAAAP